VKKRGEGEREHSPVALDLLLDNPSPRCIVSKCSSPSPSTSTSTLSATSSSPTSASSSSSSSASSLSSASSSSSSSSSTPSTPPNFISPLQFNSIRKKRTQGASRSAADGMLFLPPLAKPSFTSLDLNDAWSIELGSEDDLDLKVSLIDYDRYTPFYKYHFLQKDHDIYVGTNSSDEHFIVCVSTKLAKEEEEAEVPKRALVISSKQLSLEHPPTLWAFLPSSKKQVLKQIYHSTLGPFMQDAKLIRVEDEKIKDEVARAENNLTQFGYKFGVLLCLEGQSTEEEMLGNVHEPDEFKEFLSILGDCVDLRGFQGFSGGLDVKYGDTGEKSVYTTHQSLGVMYHVSTKLPYDSKDGQQISRKKHIGNDVVVFIYMMGKKPFDPCSFISDFNHVFIAVRRVEVESRGELGYHINVISRGGIHSITPVLPDPPILSATKKLREFLVVKAINSERAAMYAPRFAERLNLVRKKVISGIVQSHSQKKMKKGNFLFPGSKRIIPGSMRDMNFSLSTTRDEKGEREKKISKEKEEEKEKEKEEEEEEEEEEDEEVLKEQEAILDLEIESLEKRANALLRELGRDCLCDADREKRREKASQIVSQRIRK